LEYSESRDLNDTVNFEPCDSLLEKVSDVNQSDYRIQLITASPGSGSDWCYSAMAMLTGVSMVFILLKVRTILSL